MYPYPSLAQLREHRGHIDKASEFGEELQAGMTAVTPFVLLDVWKTLRVYNKNKARKAKEKMKQFDDSASAMSVETAGTDGDVTAAEDSAERVHEQDIKALGLETLCEFIDGLERLKKYAAHQSMTGDSPADITLASSRGGNHRLHTHSASFVNPQSCT